MKKRVLSVLLGTVMTAAMMTGTVTVMAEAEEPAEAETETGGFTIGLSNGYWGNTWRAQMIEDFEERCEEYKAEGVLTDYMVSNTNSDATEQLNQINAMIDADVDCILVDAVSPTTIQSAVAAAQEKGILVVIANDPAAYEGTYCVAGSNYSWEKVLATWVCEKLGGKGDIVKITGVSGNAADVLRQQADDDVLAQYPDINVLASTPGSWDETEAQSVMSTFLSSYEKIDGVLAQDVMAEGILKAYENANAEPAVMTGDYTKSFLTKWKEEGLDTIAASYAPGNCVTALDVAVGLLQGKEIDESCLVANPMDENMVNTIMVDPPYVVTNDGNVDAKWMEGLNGTKAISLDEAIELMTDEADTAALDGYLTKEEVEKFFK